MCFFFFKQKTAYEMRISDWSSDVCSSDLDAVGMTGSSAMPQIGQLPGPARWISGCIGQVQMAPSGASAAAGEMSAASDKAAILIKKGDPVQLDAGNASFHLSTKLHAHIFTGSSEDHTSELQPHMRSQLA